MIAWLVYVWPQVYPNLIASGIAWTVVLLVGLACGSRLARRIVESHRELIRSHGALRELLEAAHVDVTVDVTETVTVEKSHP